MVAFQILIGCRNTTAADLRFGVKNQNPFRAYVRTILKLIFLSSSGTFKDILGTKPFLRQIFSSLGFRESKLTPTLQFNQGEKRIFSFLLLIIASHGNPEPFLELVA